MMSDPRATNGSTTRGDTLLRRVVLPMTPQSKRRALMTTSRPGSTGSGTPLVTPNHGVSHSAPMPTAGASEQRRESEGNHVYERG